MKSIGFVDYYINEWHADNYPAWIEQVCTERGLDYKLTYAWAELDAAPNGKTTDEWCEKFGVTKCRTLAELCEKSDCIVILAPSDPEKHLRYAEAVLPYGKRTYIDKTFAPDFETAQKIFAIAAKHNTPFFSSSALRYATELDGLEATVLATTGGGSNIAEYIVHQAEMVIKLLRAEPTRVAVVKTETGYDCFADLENGKQATMTFATGLPFSVSADGQEAVQIRSSFFPALLADILRFFEDGTLSFDPKETLWVMKLREAIIREVNALEE